MCFPEGLAPADSLNDPAAESNGHELTPSAVTSAVARLASTFGPAPPLTAIPTKVQTAAALADVTNGIAATAGVRDAMQQSYSRGQCDANNMLTVCVCVCVCARTCAEAGRPGEVISEGQSVV